MVPAEGRCFTGAQNILSNSQPNILGGTCVPVQRTGLDCRRYLHKPWDCVIKELLVAPAEIAFSPRFAGQTHSVFHTAAATNVNVPANKTPVGEFFLILRKSSLFIACCKLLERRLQYIT
jgi:hypothetical protein